MGRLRPNKSSVDLVVRGQGKVRRHLRVRTKRHLMFWEMPTSLAAVQGNVVEAPVGQEEVDGAPLAGPDAPCCRSWRLPFMAVLWSRRLDG